MKLIWHPAVTLDGNIATAAGNSDWPTETDGQLFEKAIKNCQAVIVGHTTFKQYKDEVFPISGATTFVWTRTPETGEPVSGVKYISGDPAKVLAALETRGIKECILAGGTETNNAFMAAGVVDEIIATVYPLLLGKGMGLLTLENFEAKLELLISHPIGDGVVRNHYKVIR